MENQREWNEAAQRHMQFFDVSVTMLIIVCDGEKEKGSFIRYMRMNVFVDWQLRLYACGWHCLGDYLLSIFMQRLLKGIKKHRKSLFHSCFSCPSFHFVPCSFACVDESSWSRLCLHHFCRTKWIHHSFSSFEQAFSSRIIEIKALNLWHSMERWN